MSGPLVSVVLPCHQAERHLQEALDSILRQTYRNLEVVAVDDGSRDGTSALLAHAAEVDPRIRILTQPENRGLVPALNRGVREARGALVARMDADDVALPDRLARQVAAMERWPGTGVIGTGVRLMDEEGRPRQERPPRARTPAGCRFLSYLATPLVHPSILARGDVLRAHPYREAEETLHAEDYELFARMLRSGVVVRNLDAPLLLLRQTRGSVSRRFEAVQVAHFVACARHHLAEGLGEHPDPAVHAVLVNRMDRDTSPASLRRGLHLLHGLEERFLTEAPAESAEEIRGVAHQQRVDILVQAIRRGRSRMRLAALGQAFRPPWSLFSQPGRRHLGAKRLR